jgi:hypothetical protein
VVTADLAAGRLLLGDGQQMLKALPPAHHVVLTLARSPLLPHALNVFALLVDGDLSSPGNVSMFGAARPARRGVCLEHDMSLALRQAINGAEPFVFEPVYRSDARGARGGGDAPTAVLPSAVRLRSVTAGPGAY